MASNSRRATNTPACTPYLKASLHNDWPLSLAKASAYDMDDDIHDNDIDDSIVN